MKNYPSVIPVLLLACCLLFPATATADDLGSFLDKVELHASKDMGSFRADLRLNFDVSNGTLDGLFEVRTCYSTAIIGTALYIVSRAP